MDSTSSVPAPSSQSSSKALQGSNNAGESAAHAKAIKQNWLQGQVPPVLEHTSYTCSLAANGGDEHDTNHAPDQVTNSTTGPMDRPQIPAAESLVWTRKYLLSLDGGGVRGYSTLLILQELMKICGSLEMRDDSGANSSYHPIPFQIQQDSYVTKTQSTRSSRYLPVHYFDYIAGTSTGGLIAIMLGRLRMNVDECIKDYKTMGGLIFGRPRLFSMRGPLLANRPKYNHEKLKEAVESIVNNRLAGHGDHLGDHTFPSSQERCRTIVVANREKNTVSAPYLFRTYDHLKSANTTKLELNPGLASSIPIWQVARATTAAPTYFEPMKIGEEKFLDGGFGIQANNPSWYAFGEVSQMHGNNEKAIAMICSIGTGIPKKITAFPKTNTLFGTYKTLVRYTVATASDSEITHNTMLQYTTQMGTGYERFNVEGGIGSIDLGEWKIKKLKHPKRHVNVTLAAIEQATNAYLQQTDVRRRLTKMAEILVTTRKERSQYPEWNNVATGHRYHCTIDRCVASSTYHRTKEDLRNHLVNVHADQGFKYPPSTDEEKTKLEWRINRGKILHAD